MSVIQRDLGYNIYAHPSTPLPHPLWPLQSSSRLSFRCLSPNFPSSVITTTSTTTSHIVPESDAPFFHPWIHQKLGNNNYEGQKLALKKLTKKKKET